MPYRTRLHRPDHWRDETTSRLAPDVRDAMFGLSTLTDDAGFLLWRPPTLAAALYPYEPADSRESDLIRRAEALKAVELLVVAPCRCAYMPRMRRDMSVRGGEQTFAIVEFHVAAGHPDTLPTDDYLGLRRPTDDSVSVSVSSSSSSSGLATGEGAGGGLPVDGPVDISKTNGRDPTAHPPQSGRGGPPKSFKDIVGWTPTDTKVER